MGVFKSRLFWIAAAAAANRRPSISISSSTNKIQSYKSIELSAASIAAPNPRLRMGPYDTDGFSHQRNVETPAIRDDDDLDIKTR